MANIKLYINNLSGAARACYWALEVNNCLDKVDIIIIDLMKKEQLADYFLEMNPYHTVPTLKDESTGVVLYESGAIIQYLSEVFNFEVVPLPSVEKDVVVRAKTINYLHFHHSKTKALTRAVYGRLRALFTPGTAVDNQFVKDQLATGNEWLPHFDKQIGENGGFIAGNYATVADIYAYCELGHLRSYEYGYDIYNFKPYKNIVAWMDKVTALPGFQAAHEELAKFVTVSNNLGESSNQDEQL